METKKKHYTLQQYLVCYIDLLGIREQLFNGIDYHQSAVTPEKQEEIDFVSQTINSLLDNLNLLDKILHEKAGELYDFGKTLSKVNFPISKEDFVNQTGKIHFSVQQFSDSTLLYAPFNPETELVAVNILTSWMTFLAGWSLNCFDHGIFLRGAMTIGTAWELRPQCLFGPAVHDVYRLESEIAKHPRIVISSSLKKCIDQYLNADRLHGIDVDHMPTALRMVHRDSDGVDMLHYLSKVMKYHAQIFGDSSSLKNTIAVAYEKILKEYNLHYSKAAENPHEAELARRYLAVIHYFLRCSDDWDNVLQLTDKNHETI